MTVQPDQTPKEVKNVESSSPLCGDNNESREKRKDPLFLDQEIEEVFYVLDEVNKELVNR